MGARVFAMGARVFAMRARVFAMGRRVLPMPLARLVMPRSVHDADAAQQGQYEDQKSSRSTDMISGN